jgi:hypothetical protein
MAEARPRPWLTQQTAVGSCRWICRCRETLWLCWRLPAWLSRVRIPSWVYSGQGGNRYEHVKEERRSKRRAHRPPQAHSIRWSIEEVPRVSDVCPYSRGTSINDRNRPRFNGKGTTARRDMAGVGIEAGVVLSWSRARLRLKDVDWEVFPL